MTTWLGLHFGLVLTHFTEADRRLKHWAVLSTALVTLGMFISIFWGESSTANTHPRSKLLSYILHCDSPVGFRGGSAEVLRAGINKALW